jgi:hypothetical protein
MVFQLTGGELGHLFLLAERLAARRAFELDDIAFGITDIDGWTFKHPWTNLLPIMER